MTVTEIVATGPDDTEQAGAILAQSLCAGDVVALVGELGAGKTCFVRGLARGLGVIQPVTSPTFVLVNHYAGRLPVYHLDAYRTGSLTEVLDIGYDEFVSGGGVTVVEWAEKVGPLLAPDAIVVRIAGLGDEPRRIRIERPAGVSDAGH